MSKEKEFLKRLLGTFKIEAAEHVAAITSGLVELEKSKDPRRRAELVETVFREAHSLKGAARTVNSSTVETVCQSLETVFSVLKTKQIELKCDLFDLLHKALELVRNLIDSSDAEVGASDKAVARSFTLQLDQAAKELEAESPTLISSDAVVELPDARTNRAKGISMTPFSTLFEFLPGMVRSLLAEQGKEAELTVSGSGVEVDRRILEEMKDPLVHLIRNCVDHGIEKPSERASKGKSRVARVSVAASHHDSGKVELTVSDDGGGIDIGKVKASAVKVGILSSRDAERLDAEGSCLLVFRSGVSTSPIVTDLSGRGIGLAIVQEKVEKLGGVIACESSPGKGASFRMLLPVMLATVRGLLVRVGDHFFVIPTGHVRRVIRAPLSEVKPVEGRDTISVEGMAVPLIRLAGALDLSPGRKNREETTFLNAAVLESEGKLVAFVVDEVLYEREFLVKGLGRQLKRVRNITGATLVASGAVVLVLNVSDLMKSAAATSEAPLLTPSSPEEGEERKSLLVVEDSVTARTLLKNILETAGYDVTTAVDGIEAYALLKGAPFDLVISDVDMPRMSGFELTAKIRSDRQVRDLPVILVTALDSRSDRERGIDVGASAYIVKSSFDQSNLLEVIKRLI